jgi:hypothetical protein
LSGSIFVIEAITLDEDQSCQALKAAWIKKTAKRTIARAKLATAGAGSPRGFHDTKTSIAPVSRILPNPLKK